MRRAAALVVALLLQPVTVSAAGGFGASVRLTLSGLPSGTSYSFSPNPVMPTADTPAKTTLTLRAPTTNFTGTLTIKVKGASGTTLRTTDFRLTIK